MLIMMGFVRFLFIEKSMVFFTNIVAYEVLLFALFFIIVIPIINFEIMSAEHRTELYEHTNTYLVYTLTTSL
jgi:multisubunit Na+/H+ antiporter MnhG subunit